MSKELKITNIRRVAFNRDMGKRALCSPMTVKKNEDGKYVASIDNQPDLVAVDTLESVAIRKCNQMLKEKFDKGELTI